MYVKTEAQGASTSTHVAAEDSKVSALRCRMPCCPRSQQLTVPYEKQNTGEERQTELGSSSVM